jgi:hypothetical protein
VKVTAGAGWHQPDAGRNSARQGLWRACDGHGIAGVVPARPGAGLFRRRGECAGAGTFGARCPAAC